MIIDLPVRPGLRILVTSRPVDFRRYAERTIMRSPRGDWSVSPF
jgi:hypothetical protein